MAHHELGSGEKKQKRLARLRQELHDEEVELLPANPDGRVLVGSKLVDSPDELFAALVDELADARWPLVHETRRSSYGVIILPHPDEIKLANGRWFSKRILTLTS